MLEGLGHLAGVLTDHIIFEPRVLLQLGQPCFLLLSPLLLVAVDTEAVCVIHSVRVDAVLGLRLPAVDVVAVVAHSPGVVLAVNVLALVHHILPPGPLLGLPLGVSGITRQLVGAPVLGAYL